MSDLIKRAEKHAEYQIFSYSDTTTANIIHSLLDQLEQKDKELESLNYRLKECLNHNSLVATRGELNNKDKRITKLEKAIQTAIDDDDSWGCDVTMQLMLMDVMAKGDGDE